MFGDDMSGIDGIDPDFIQDMPTEYNKANTSNMEGMAQGEFQQQNAQAVRDAAAAAQNVANTQQQTQQAANVAQAVGSAFGAAQQAIAGSFSASGVAAAQKLDAMRQQGALSDAAFAARMQSLIKHEQAKGFLARNWIWVGLGVIVVGAAGYYYWRKRR